VISSDRLEPGKSGQIKATVDTTGKMGRIEKHVSIYSNDPQNPVITVSLSFDIVQK
jgi:hypothetical protein